MRKSTVLLVCVAVVSCAYGNRRSLPAGRRRTWRGRRRRCVPAEAAGLRRGATGGKPRGQPQSLHESGCTLAGHESPRSSPGGQPSCGAESGRPACGGGRSRACGQSPGATSGRRPGAGAATAQSAARAGRPAAGGSAYQRPSQSQVSSFLNLPQQPQAGGRSASPADGQPIAQRRTGHPIENRDDCPAARRSRSPAAADRARPRAGRPSAGPAAASRSRARAGIPSSRVRASPGPARATAPSLPAARGRELKPRWCSGRPGHFIPARHRRHELRRPRRQRDRRKRRCRKRGRQCPRRLCRFVGLSAGRLAHCCAEPMGLHRRGRPRRGTARAARAGSARLPAFVVPAETWSLPAAARRSSMGSSSAARPGPL